MFMVKNVICPFCDELFKDEFELEKHIRTHEIIKMKGLDWENRIDKDESLEVN
jgi:uncharacterized C2H2 Zn-finger protein